MKFISTCYFFHKPDKPFVLCPWVGLESVLTHKTQTTKEQEPWKSCLGKRMALFEDKTEVDLTLALGN